MCMFEKINTSYNDLPTQKTLIIYHKEDNDGVFSGALMYNYLMKTLHTPKEDIVLLGTEYNSLAEFSKDNEPEDLHKYIKRIIIVDLSFNDYKYMKRLWKEFGTDFIWCDHHAPIIKTSKEQHFDDIVGIRDTTRSAILNVWKYLYDQFDEAYNKKKVPELLRILSAWDSWTFEKEKIDDEYARQVNKAVTYEYNLEMSKVLPLVEDIVNCYVNKDGSLSSVFKEKPLIKQLQKTGKLLCDYEDRTFEDIVKNVGDCSWKIMLDSIGDNKTWRPACAIFHQGATNSKMFNSLRQLNPDIMNAIVFKHAKNGNWTISLYNVRECDEKDWFGRFHCGQFMKEHYKGGGHPGAAGCTITQEQFIKILKKKEL